MDKIIVRTLKGEDAGAIARIYGAIIQKPVHPDFNQLILYHANRADGGCFVATINGVIVGFLISHTLILGFGVEKSAWIAVLGVDPDFMGMGIGDRMAEETVALYKSKGIERLYTSVQWHTADMLSFFRTQGFEKSNHINLKKEL